MPNGARKRPLAPGVRLPCALKLQLLPRDAWPGEDLPVQSLPQAGDPDGRVHISFDQAAAHTMVSGDVFPVPEQNRHIHAGTDAPDRCQLPQCLADETQTDAGHV